MSFLVYLIEWGYLKPLMRSGLLGLSGSQGGMDKKAGLLGFCDVTVCVTGKLRLCLYRIAWTHRGWFSTSSYILNEAF